MFQTDSFHDYFFQCFINCTNNFPAYRLTNRSNVPRYNIYSKSTEWKKKINVLSWEAALADWQNLLQKKTLFKNKFVQNTYWNQHYIPKTYWCRWTWYCVSVHKKNVCCSKRVKSIISFHLCVDIFSQSSIWKSNG